MKFFNYLELYKNKTKEKIKLSKIQNVTMFNKSLCEYRTVPEVHNYNIVCCRIVRTIYEV